MNKEEIYELMDRFESGSLYSMKLECEDFSLELQKAPPAPVMAPPLPAPLWPGGPVSAAAPAPAPQTSDAVSVALIAAAAALGCAVVIGKRR